ncbi:hypothetical protein CPC08DRAFT_696904 [Agrocybe pediades]|nr:hypothetical protein CPC08DRAFT_696904 [Agrocybe pediades]
MDSRASSLTPCSSPAPPSIVQPDHFYGSNHVQLPPSPHSDGKTFLDPADDLMANRGIPVFKPTMEEFRDFEAYMNRVECWGSRSGIVKVIPPKEWTDALPSLKEQLKDVKIKTPIEQHMMGSGGLFRQENMEKRKVMSVREWVELCTKDEYRAPGVMEVGLSARNTTTIPLRTRPPRRAKKAESVKAESSGPASSDLVIKEEPQEEDHTFAAQDITTPPHSDESPPPSNIPATTSTKGKKKKQPVKREEPKPRPKRATMTKEVREANQAERAARDIAFLDVFDPETEWLPPGTTAVDYTPEFCQKLERQYWRNCGLGKPPWYGADTLGSLFTDETTSWNVGHLPSTLSRLLPASDQGLPGVNTPYLYFGMWRATFAWHVEDMDLFSINYIHFGAPKFWYAIPQGRAGSLETTMRSFFPKDTSQCPQFLRHKSFLASPSILANGSCRPNYLVQHAGEFVITYPRGYHAGFNLGMNCAESVNFALDSWLEIGRRAKVCECISDSVRIDVDQLLKERELEQLADDDAAAQRTPRKKTKKTQAKIAVDDEAEDEPPPPTKAQVKKRKSETTVKEESTKLKRIKITHSPSKQPSTISIPARPIPKLSVTLKLGPRPTEPEPYPCCLCISMSKDGLLKVHDPPLARKDAMEAAGNPKVWMAHELCASIVPETWVDEAVAGDLKEKMVFGVDGIVKDRWNLKCSACTKNKPRCHGAPVQCTKGKCPRAFHVSCARDGGDQGIVFQIMREVEKEVVVLGPTAHSAPAPAETPIEVIPTEQMQYHPQGSSNQDGMAVDTPLTIPTNAVSPPPKFVKKLEAQVLCVQHNPTLAAQKKAIRNDKIRTDLLALPYMARIKIRVSSGVFEVSLIRVVEESSSVEVLWDRGLKREFKWGSVVWGNTEGPVQQKPSEAAPEPERPPTVAYSVPAYPSILSATAYTNPYVVAESMYAPGVQAGMSNGTPAAASGSASTSQLRKGPYDYYAYNAQFSGHQMTYANYIAAYYAENLDPSAYTTRVPYGNAQHYRGTNLNWQQPYQGPQQSRSAQPAMTTKAQNQNTPAAQAANAESSKSISTPATSAASPSNVQPDTQQESTSSSPSQSAPNPTPVETQQSSSSTPSEFFPSNPTPVSSQAPVYSPAIYAELAALAALPPEEIAEILRNNAQLRDLVWAAVDQAKKAEAETGVKAA